MKKIFFQKETVYHMNKQCFIIFQNWKNCCQEIHSRETAISIKAMFFWKIQQFPENKFPRTDLEWNLLLSEVNLPKFSEHFSDAFSLGTSGQNWGLTIFKCFGLVFYSSGRGPRDVFNFQFTSCYNGVTSWNNGNLCCWQLPNWELVDMELVDTSLTSTDRSLFITFVTTPFNKHSSLLNLNCWNFRPREPFASSFSLSWPFLYASNKPFKYHVAPCTENKSKLVEFCIWLEKPRKKKGGKPVQKKQSLFDYKNVMTTTYIAELVSLRGQETQKHLKLTIFNKFEHSWYLPQSHVNKKENLSRNYNTSSKLCTSLEIDLKCQKKKKPLEKQPLY